MTPGRNMTQQQTTQIRIQSEAACSRLGFTMVEMLVSVALVLIMMIMFTQVFQLASGSMSQQRGIAKNDQRARTMSTIIRQDIERRTFKNVVPWDPAEWSGISADTRRSGYLYISENDPNNDADDVLQFTIEYGTDDDPVQGRARLLDTTLASRNEPDWDDGQPENGLGSSTRAEVAYFVRNGNLYRRTLMIRKPLNTTDDAQPENFSAYTGTSFWFDYDYSAAQFAGSLSFHSFDDSLDNSSDTFVLGIPRYRFGHDHLTHHPREFGSLVGPGTDGNYGTGDDVTINTSEFLGRFTHEETSSINFSYPMSGTSSPMARSASLPMRNDTYAVIPYQHTPSDGGSRRGEDILMTNVHSFDVKVWDDVMNGFVDIGHNLVNGVGVNGDYHQASNQHASGSPSTHNYGPSSTNVNNRIYDTWHSRVDLNGDSTHEPPPFKPVNGGGNPKPLRAIQITIRFYDTTSEQYRQMTIVESLRN